MTACHTRIQNKVRGESVTSIRGLLFFQDLTGDAGTDFLLSAGLMPDMTLWVSRLFLAVLFLVGIKNHFQTVGFFPE